jgi:hypothetical protein
MSVPFNPHLNPGPDVKFGLWVAPESPVNIEYSLVVIEEIRHDVAEGYQRLSRGGIEVGGVLYGTHDDRTVRVLAMRSIACEHARGPGFVFSDKDRMALHEQLVRDKDDSHLQGMVSVGWFLSHTRSEIVLNQSDQEIFSIFFPSPWQVTLVVRPGRGGAMRAGFFVRDAEGAVKGEQSYLEFNFPDRLAALMERSPDRPPKERPERRGPSFQQFHQPFQRPEPAAPSTEIRNTPALSEPALAGPQLLQPQAPRRKWPWLVAWGLAVLLAAVLGVRYWMMSLPPEPIALSVVEREGQLQIEWNHAAKPVAGAVAGSLEIVDGPDPRIIPLTRQQLAAGKFTYVRKTGDIEVRITVQDPDGVKTQEVSRYLGRPPETPKDSQELIDVQQHREELEAEVQRLRKQNDAQAAKIQQLERLLRVLQSRLGIDQGKQ